MLFRISQIRITVAVLSSLLSGTVRLSAQRSSFVYCLLFVRATVQFIGISYYLS